eukprot:scaffold47222_cov72-Phaeocystis_antarctica.AAC.9
MPPAGDAWSRQWPRRIRCGGALPLGTQLAPPELRARASPPLDRRRAADARRCCPVGHQHRRHDSRRNETGRLRP